VVFGGFASNREKKTLGNRGFGFFEGTHKKLLAGGVVELKLYSGCLVFFPPKGLVRCTHPGGLSKGGRKKSKKKKKKEKKKLPLWMWGTIIP